MSLPKRDGVHDRYYLIHKPDTSPEVLAEADACIQDILDGTARENHSAFPTVVRNHNGTPFLPDQLLERYLFQFPLKGFPYEDPSAIPCGGWRAGRRLITHCGSTSKSRCGIGTLRSESGRISLRPFRPVPCGRSYARRMWMKGCCASPAMWRSAIPCMG